MAAMFDDPENLDPEEAYKLLEELQLNQPAQVLENKSDEESAIRIAVEIAPGNASEREGPPEIGVTSKIGKLHVVIACEFPLLVGDVYRLEFERKRLDIGAVYAVCRRCTMLHEDRFEARMSLFTPIDFSTAKL